jgi:hypothetical protein
MKAWFRLRRIRRAKRARVEAQLSAAGLSSHGSECGFACLFCRGDMRNLCGTGVRISPRGTRHEFTEDLGFVCLHCALWSQMPSNETSYKTIEAFIAERPS